MAKLSYRSGSPSDVDADVLVLPFFEGPEAGPGVREVSGALGTDLVELLSENKIKGRPGDYFFVPSMGRLAVKTVVLAGLGKRDDVKPDSLRSAMGKLAQRLSKFERVATTLADAGGRGGPDAVQATVEGLLLGAYRFDRYKGAGTDGSDDRPALREITLVGSARSDGAAAQDAMERAQVVADSVAWARDLVNTPALDATPDYLAREAQRVAREVGLKVKIWREDELRRGGFGGILGVGQGSVNPPRMIELTYNGGTGDPIAITGKGVTFDSGGLSIKDAKNMEWMKADMAGAAAILGVMRAVGLLRPRINVIAAIPSSENLPGGSSIRPGDVLKHRGGKTSEVLNTDAEGRLILADALAYMAEKNPRAMIDCATLTGAAVVALGEDLWAVMGNDRALIRDVIEAGEEVGEPGWELPLWDGYRKQIESPIADVKNIGNRYGGAITAALFLKEFVGDRPWIHMDVAGTAYAENPRDFWGKGATGSPARTIIRYILNQAEGDGSGSRASRSRPSGRSAAGRAGGKKSSARSRSSSRRR